MSASAITLVRSPEDLEFLRKLSGMGGLVEELALEVHKILPDLQTYVRVIGSQDESYGFHPLQYVIETRKPIRFLGIRSPWTYNHTLVRLDEGHLEDLVLLGGDTIDNYLSLVVEQFKKNLEENGTDYQPNGSN
ncbi:MAG: hypothetical protein EPN86_04420 [Nanoarchaeota archaeon]|nr:MAG: hypothetical protein EPN86_04420 [Nanoarchaeota archaeon]